MEFHKCLPRHHEICKIHIMYIKCNSGIVFIIDDDLLVVNLYKNLPLNNCLIPWTKYCVDCWKIDFYSREYDIGDIDGVFLCSKYTLITMSDGVVFVKGINICDNWQQIYFSTSITDICFFYIYGFIIDIDKNLWIWNKINYDNVEKKYIFTNLKLLNLSDTHITSIDCINWLFLSEDGRIFQLISQQLKLCERFQNFSKIISMEYNINNIGLLDIYKRLHFGDLRGLEIIELINEPIVCFTLATRKLYFASENKLYYKLVNEYDIIHEITCVPFNSVITVLTVNNNDLLTVVCMKGNIYFITFVDDTHIFRNQINTGYDFSPLSSVQIKSARKN